MHILIVEDDISNSLYIQAVMKLNKHTFDSVNNGKEAVKIYKKNKYNTILMDIKLPIMDGMTATELIRQYEKNNNLLPSNIIAITALSKHLYKTKILESGIDHFLEKPFNIKSLMNVIMENSTID